jgi:hypothetical protein
MKDVQLAFVTSFGKLVPSKSKYFAEAIRAIVGEQKYDRGAPIE